MEPLSLTASVIAIVGACGSIGKGLKKLASRRHAERDLLILQDDVSELQSYVEDVSEVVSELEKMTNRPSYQRVGTALERAKSTLLKLEQLVVYDLTTIPDSNGKVDIDPSAWFTNQPVIRSSRAEILDRKLSLMAALGLLNLSAQCVQMQQQRSFDRRLEDGESFNGRHVLAGVDSVRELVNQSLAQHSQHETTLQIVQESIKPATMPTDLTMSSDPPCKVSNLPQQTPDDPQQRDNQKGKKQPRINHPNRAGRATAYTPPITVHDAFMKDPPDFLAEKLLKKQHLSNLHFPYSCNGQCDCICHGRSNAKTPDFAVGALGPVFIYYKGPSPVKTCVSHGCKRGFLKFFLAFPPWLSNWYGEATITSFLTSGSGMRSKFLAVSRKFAPENAPIFWAVRTGARPHISRLLDRKEASSTDASYPEGKTVLHIAVESLNLEIIRLLLSSGADPLKSSAFGISPLTEAWTMVLGRRNTAPPEVLDVLRTLLESSEAGSDCSHFGFSTLHKACLGLCDRSLDDIILETARSRIDQSDATGRTALSWVAQKGDAKSLLQLLSLGSEPDKRDYSGKSPLHWSLFAGSDEYLQILLHAKADIDTKDKLGRTPLCLAAQTGSSLKFIKTLLSFGAEPRSRDGHGMMPLLWAAHYDRPRILSCLSRLGASVHDTDPNGRTILHIAISLNNHGVLRLILKRWPLLCARADKSGRSFIHLAACLGDLSTLRILQRANLRGLEDANGGDYTGRTPLEYAQWRLMDNEQWSNLVIEPRDSDPLEWYDAFKALLVSCSEQPEEPFVEDSYPHLSLDEVLAKLGSDEEEEEEEEEDCEEDSDGAWEDDPK